MNLLKTNGKKAEMNKINLNGDIITDPAVIKNVVNKFYSDLYNKNDGEIDTDESFLSEMFKVQDNEANYVAMPITLAELWAALKPLKDTAPGPDGISHIYLKRLWDIMGPLILNAWNYSLEINKKTFSHERSYLRLIPKSDKDTTLISNWRPITLSNCDHKLITRAYNNRLIKVLENYISNTQTAYIKNRNITDNIRIVSSAIQLSNCEPNINGSILALDAQKAFDSVNHEYLSLLLKTIGLTTFEPIFRLLYQNLSNDLIINNELAGNHKVRNGVKQGDALSCTLFILAIEPLMRNINKNDSIKQLKSTFLDLSWPKLVGYADDITCITLNDINSKQAIFEEYERLSRNSGLVLNVDKTEMYNFVDARGANPYVNAITRIMYMGQHFDIKPINEIKINGIILCKNRQLQSTKNWEILTNKMEKHFASWSRRNLTLLGKIQIYKTFGLSQYLYHLSVIEPDPQTWKDIYKKIDKFIWNKYYISTQAQAPFRIKKEVLLTPTREGGFGMIDLKEVVTSLRLRRHFYLRRHRIHPISLVIAKLVEETGYIGTSPLLDVDEITALNLTALSDKRIRDLKMPDWQLESDLVLHANLARAKISDLVRPRKKLGNEMNYLQLTGMTSFSEIVRNGGRPLAMLLKIAIKDLQPALKKVANYYRNDPMPDADNMDKIMVSKGRWVEDICLGARLIREIFKVRQPINPKIILIDEEQKASYFGNLSKLVSINNKNRMLRLLHGDVYTAERQLHYGMSDSDRCRRCFDKESIVHLLTECAYSWAVYSILGLNDDALENILGIGLNRYELEIRADLLNYLIFQQRMIPPKILVRSTLEKYSSGLVDNRKMVSLAKQYLEQISGS